MRILVDGLPLFGKWQRGGIGHYTTALLRAATEIDAENEYIAWHWDRSTDTPVVAPNLEYRSLWWFPLKAYNLLLRRFVAPPLDALLRARADLYLFTNFVRYPLARRAKSLVIIYDVSFLVAGEHTASRSKQYLTKWVPKSIAAADHIVTISENAKDEIIRHYGADPSSITVITPAVDHAVFSPADDPADAALEVPDNFVLFIGTIEPRKNLVRLLDAYGNLPASLQQRYPLVLAGGKGWQDQAIQAKFAQLRDAPIIRLGYVPEAHLPGLYRRASVLVFPSLYEGFGMPPLEAMACGTPVISADNSSLPEAVGDAALLVDALDTAAITDAMERVLTSPDLAADMRDRGLRQAQRFNWANQGRALVELINRVGACSRDTL